MYKYNTVLSHTIDLTLLVPVYWILYALPHSFTIPTTRIPLPFPLPDNTAQATTILLVSLTYISCSLLLRPVPPLYRFTIPITLTLLSITSYELIHSTLYRLSHSLPHDTWHTQQFFLTSASLLLLLALKLFLHHHDISTITPNTLTLLLISTFSLLTLYQWQRGFYITTPDDLTTILHKTLPFLINSSLLARRSPS